MQVKKLKILVFLAFFLFPLQAQTPEKVWNCYLVTVGPGDPLYTWFGHTGLILENTESGKAVFYDFGNFSFKSDHFYRNFAMGRLIYLSIGVSAQAYMDYIVTENRNVTVQALNLPEDAIEEMAEYLAWKVQPGNNTYLYHHYLDNCSTRIRDLIDQATGGQLKEATAASAGTSFRRSFRRYSSHSWWADWLLSFLQGRTIDEGITYWDTMFLPDELMKQVGNLQIRTEEGTEPLVLKTEYLRRAQGKRSIPAAAPSNIGRALLYGFIGGVIILLLQWGSLTIKTGIRRTSRILLTIILLTLSIAGGLLYFISFFTDHLVARENVNILLIHPFYLIPIFLFPKKNTPGRIRIINLFWQIQGILMILMALINLLPSFHQGNQRTMGLLLPLILLQVALLPLVIRKQFKTAGRSSGLLGRATLLQHGPNGPDGP